MRRSVKSAGEQHVVVFPAIEKAPWAMCSGGLGWDLRIFRDGQGAMVDADAIVDDFHASIFPMVV